MGFCYLPPERVKMGQGSKWVKDSLVEVVKTIESNWAKRSQVGPGPF